MKHLVVLLLALFSYASGLAQLDPTLTFFDCEVLGVKQLDKAFLVFSKGRSKHKLNCRLISQEGELEWENEVNLPKLSGYSFNQLQVFSGERSIYLIHQLDNAIHLNKLNLLNGELEIIEEQFRFNTPEGELNQWLVRNDSLFHLSGDNGGLWMKPYLDEDFGYPKLLFQLPDQYRDGYFSPQFTQRNSIYCTAYKLERNHGKMHLYILKYNTNNHRFHVEEQDLDLEYTSFTYNSSFDKRVLGIVPQNNGFYLLGKLDIGFKKPYPTTKLGDNFIGFWIAKYTYDLRLEYFSEIPFQYFEGLIPANVIQKPAVIDIKEDLKKGTHVNINELQGIIYGNKYLVYIDSLGKHQAIEGGRDEFNVLEYDVKGLRNAGRTSKARLMNDDWPVYASNSFLYLFNKPDLYSFATQNTLRLVQNPKSGLRKEKGYTFIPFEDRVVYLEYLNKKSGTLTIYSQEY